jgi:hypothetical protein
MESIDLSPFVTSQLGKVDGLKSILSIGSKNPELYYSTLYGKENTRQAVNTRSKLCSQVVRSFVVRFAYCLWRPRRTRRRREKGRATPGGMASAVPPRAATSAHARTELACQTQRLPSAAALRPAQETAPLRRADDDQASARPPQGRIANPVPARLHSYAGAPLATFARHGAVCLCALGSPARRA